MRATFGAEAVREATQAQRQHRFVEDLALVYAAERDLRRADEHEVRVCERVDVRLGATRVEAEPRRDLAARDVRRLIEREAALAQEVERETHERVFEQHHLVLQKVELLSRNLRTGFEVDQVVLRGELDVIERREAERRRRADHAQLEVLLVGVAVGNRGMRHVRNQRLQRAELVTHARELGLERGLALLQLLAQAALLVARLAPLHLARERIAPLLYRLLLGNQRAAALVERGQAIEVDRDIALRAVRSNRVQILDDEAQVEHGSGPFSCGVSLSWAILRARSVAR